MFTLALTLFILPIGASGSIAAEVPAVFAPGIISGGAHDSAPAFDPDGSAVYFTRSAPGVSVILVSNLTNGAWSAPVVAEFSGRWPDMEPAQSPDGSYLIFVSSRPADDAGPLIDGAFNGKAQIGQGGALWRVDQTEDGWSPARRLPENINQGASVFAPSITRDGSLFFMKPDPTTGRFRLFRAQATVSGDYLDPEPLPFSDGTSTDVDPAVDPDERFIIFGSGRRPGRSVDLFISYRQDGGWSQPAALADAINSSGSDAEPRLSPDGSILYYSSERLAPTAFPRSAADAAAGADAMNSWNNGLYNIWSVPLAAALTPTAN